MRFYLDPETAIWFRRLFLRPAAQLSFPKTYQPLVTRSWQSDPPCLDLTETKRNKRFVKWLVRTLKQQAGDATYTPAFLQLAEGIEKMADRSVVELLGDLVDTGRTQVKIDVGPPPSPWRKAIKHLRRKITPREDPTA